MDKIWYRNPSKSAVIGRCGGDEKRMTTQNRQKSNAKKIKKFFLKMALLLPILTNTIELRRGKRMLPCEVNSIMFI